MTRTRTPTLFRPTRRQALSLMGMAGATSLAAPGLLTGALAQGETAGEPNGQLIVGFSQEPTVFNPHMPHIEVDEGVHFAIFDPLFYVDEAGLFQPALAAEVPTVENGGISSDGLNWRVRLREGVTWHDGQPFTAEDVKFTLELLVDPNFRSWRRAGHDQVRELTVVSPTELTFKLAEPYAPYPSILASTFIVPRHILGAVDDKNSAPFNQAPIGTGPFKWVSRVSGDRIEMEANPDYFGDGPFLERLILRYIPDLTVLYTQFRTGDIDVIGLQWITPDNYDEASQLPDRVVNVVPSATVESFSLNMGRPQFQEAAVRQALYHALDKQSIIDALYFGLPAPTETYMPQQSLYYNPDLPPHEYDPDRANELLDEAGWELGDDGVRAKNGVRLAFTNSTTAGNHIREQAQQFIQQSFREIGVEMSISNLPPAVMWGEYWLMSEFDTVIVGINFLTGSDPDVSDYLASTSIGAQGGAGQNTWQYKSADVDRLLREGGTLFVPEERRSIYHELQSVVRNDLPFLPMFQYANPRGSKAGITGITPNVNVRIDTWNVRVWRWANT